MSTKNNLITNMMQKEYENPFIQLLDKREKKEECTPETIYMVQTQTRILIKSILYRLIAFSLTFITSYYFTGNYKKSFGIGIIVELSQTIVYYLYEQVWNNINWGYTSNTTLL